MTFLDELLSIRAAAESYIESVKEAEKSGIIDSKSASLLINEVSSYVSSAIIMSNFSETEIRTTLSNKAFDFYMTIIVKPTIMKSTNLVKNDERTGSLRLRRSLNMRDLEDTVSTYNERMILIKSALDLISASMRRALYGGEREKVYRTLSIRGQLPVEGEVDPLYQEAFRRGGGGEE